MKTMSVSFRPIDGDGHPKTKEEVAEILAWGGSVLDKMSMSGKLFQQHASDDRSELMGDLRKRAPSPPPIPGSEPQPEPDAEPGPDSEPDVVPPVPPGREPDTSPDVFPPEPAPV